MNLIFLPLNSNTRVRSTIQCGIQIEGPRLTYDHMSYIHRHDVIPYLVLVLTKLDRHLTFMGDWKRRGIYPRYLVGLRVWNGGESEPLYILSRNHVNAVSTVNDNSIALLSTLGKGTNDSGPMLILIWSSLGERTSHHLEG